MIEQIQKARMRQKHDQPIKWREVKNFVPKPGEIIVYDKDSNSRNQRLKIGDGQTLVNDLGMIAGEVYAQQQEPLDASEGAVWIQADGNASDIYGVTEEVIGYKYNGVLLPFLPNWNKVVYPNGFLSLDNQIYTLFITKEDPLPLYGDDGTFSGLRFIYKQKEDKTITQYHYRKWTYNSTTNSWETDGREYKVQNYTFPNVFWTYKNILNSGTIALGATQPIPVYKLQEDVRNIDWNIPNEERLGYIKNRPIWHEQRAVSTTWNPNAEFVNFLGLPMRHISNLHPGIEEMSDLVIYTTTGPVAYTDVQMPAIFADYSAESHPYTISRFCYEENAESWKEVEFYYSSSPFYYDKTSDKIMSDAETLFRVFSKTNNTWGDQQSITSNTLIFQPNTKIEGTFYRFASSSNILDETGFITYYANCVTTIEGNYNQYTMYEKNVIVTMEQLNELMTDENVGSDKFFVLNGAAAGIASNCLILTTFITINGAPTTHFLGCVIMPSTNEEMPQGIYFFENAKNLPQMARFDFNYSAIEVNEKYQNVFKKKDALNVYSLDETVLINLASIIGSEGNIEAALGALEAEIARFNVGEVLLIPTALLDLLNQAGGKI